VGIFAGDCIKMEKKDIRTLGEDELSEAIISEGEQPYRARQIYQWIWAKSALDFDDMTNLSKPLREALKKNYEFRPVRIDLVQQSSDQTVKLAFRLFDDHIIEGVLIPSVDRMTACVSSQAGCSLSCKFCATGYLERQRNLTPGEIYDQVIHIRNTSIKYFEKPLTNIVFMGMGEPLLNYKNVMLAIDHITSPSGLGMSPKRITLSTAGISKMIKKLGDDAVKLKLALSLHAANDVKSNSLKSLLDALVYYYTKTKSIITLEYIVFKDFNDTLDDARDLYDFVKRIPAKVNIIEYNPIDQASFSNTTEDRLEMIRKYLEDHRVNVRLRRSRGKDIDAACGQLANKR
jgi:23S rRNA (adenine2503-C2)-methyltransferase